MAHDVGPAAALVLGAVLAWAAAGKARRRAATASSFRGLRLPAPGGLAVAVPAVEAALAVALVLAPAVASWPTLALLLAFSAVVLRAVLAGEQVPCNCFGSGGAGDSPVSSLDLVRNAGLAALAVLASGAPDGSALWPGAAALLVVAALTAAGGVTLRAIRRGGPGPT
ncbi:MAG TPA: MauE/DoxX family redox-associated membrane protein [Acidimicrobiales bacterium]|nr:MauE/DoxX family redox-associated membrane protein [Acidimicrobiales bacterium]